MKILIAIILATMAIPAFPDPQTQATRHILKCKTKPNGEAYCVRVYQDSGPLDPADIDLNELMAAEELASAAISTGADTEVRSFACGLTAHCRIIGVNPKTREVYIECRCGG